MRQNKKPSWDGQTVLRPHSNHHHNHVCGLIATGGHDCMRECRVGWYFVEFEEDDWGRCAAAFDFTCYGSEERLLVQDRAFQTL
jgi:hypothetical protein